MRLRRLVQTTVLPRNTDSASLFDMTTEVGGCLVSLVSRTRDSQIHDNTV